MLWRRCVRNGNGCYLSLPTGAGSWLSITWSSWLFGTHWQSYHHQAVWSEESRGQLWTFSSRGSTGCGLQYLTWWYKMGDRDWWTSHLVSQLSHWRQHKDTALWSTVLTCHGQIWPVCCWRRPGDRGMRNTCSCFSPSPWAWLVSHPFTCQGCRLGRLYHPSLKLSQHQGCGSWKNHFLETASALCNDRVGLKLINIPIKVCMRTILCQKMGKNDWNLRGTNLLDGCSTLEILNNPMLWCK